MINLITADLLITISGYMTLPLMLYYGIKISLTDIYRSKIYNKDIINFLIYGFFIQILTLTIKIFFYSAGIKIVLLLLLNSVLAFITGLIFWYLNMWAAGDVKFYFAVSFLIPYDYLVKTQKFFPSFDCMVNIFFITLLFILCEVIILLIISFINIIKKSRHNGFNLKVFFEFSRIKFDFYNIFKIIFNLMFFLLIFNKIRSILIEFASIFVKFDMLYVYLIIFIFYGSIAKYLKKRLIFIFSLIGIAVYIITSIIIKDYSFIHTIMGILSAGFIIMMCSRLLTYYLEKSDIREISVENLKKNMILAKKSYSFLRLSNDKNINFKSETMDGLTEEQVTIIKKNNPGIEILVENTFPFAPFITIGTFLTLFLLKNNVIELMINFFRK